MFEQEYDIIKNDVLGKSLGWLEESCWVRAREVSEEDFIIEGWRKG